MTSLGKQISGFILRFQSQLTVVVYLLLSLFLLAMATSSVAWAATFTVNSTADAVDANLTDGICATALGECTLRAAIQEANAQSVQADTVNVPAGTYTLSVGSDNEDAAAEGDLDITDNLTITGADESTTIIDANGIDRVFDVKSGVTVGLSGLTIQNGNPNGQVGGGILNACVLTLTNVSVSNNNNAKEGGGIYNLSTSSLTLTDVIVSGNTAADKGGGIWIKDSAVGAQLNNVTLSGNSVTKLGGGVFAEATTLTITNSTLSANSTSDEGGGIYSKTSTLTLTNVTFSGNSAKDGGGIGNYSNSILTNVTFSSNSATGIGGAILEQATGNMTLKNTIIANSPTGGDCFGTITSLGNNLDSDGTCGFALTADPLLGPLQDNGGPTFTHALTAGSPAIDTGTNIGAPATDQRGVARPIDGDGDLTATTDIGAYEAGPVLPIPDISVDCDFSDWTDGDGAEFVVDDEGGADDWNNPPKFDITRFGVASNLSDTFYLLFGFDDILPGQTAAAVLIDTDLDDNVNYALVLELNDTASNVTLFTCDDSISYGCGNQTFSTTYSTPGDYCVGTGTGPWNTDTFVELQMPYTDLGSFTGGTSILSSLISYKKANLTKPMDSIYADYYDRTSYDTDTGEGETVDDAGTPTIRGTVFIDEGTTSAGIGRTVKLLNNGSLTDTDITDEDGYYFMVVPSAAGDNLLAYIDGDATYQGTTVTVFDGVQLNDLDIYAGHVITRHDNSGTLSTANMATAKGGDTDNDILYSVSGGTDLTVTGSGTELYVPTGYSFAPGGDVTTPNMENLGTFTGGTGAIDINGTLTLSGGSFTSTSGTMSVTGDFAHSGGTFSHNSGTVTLDGTGQGISGTTSFNNLTKTVTTADTLTFEAGSTQTIAGTVTLQGADGNLLALRSSSEGTRWNFTLTPGAAKPISYVDVKDSDASGSDATLKPINPSYSVDSDNTIDWFPLLPDIILLKSVQTFSDPFNGETNPKAIPGAVMLYTVTVTNQGDGATDADKVFITDPVPANTELFVGDIDGPGPAAGPVLFTDGTSPNDSGLNYTFIAIDDLTDDVAFSIDGTNYDYIPVPDADGFDANITHVRINPKGTFNAASGGDVPTFEVKFKVRVE